jgi:hypothetical protein
MKTVMPLFGAAVLAAVSFAAFAQVAPSATNAASQAAASPDLAQSIASDPFVKLDKNRDGFVTKDEANARLRKNWAKFDRNQDGKVDSAEYAAAVN